VHVVDDPRPYALTLPGRAGRIVVSSGLADLLDGPELEAVLAHEQAHSRHRHDRHLLLAELAAAWLPPLGVLSARTRFSVERWADDIAAAMCRDRQLVADTLAKVALHQVPMTTAAGVASFGGLGVLARVRALLEPPVTDVRRSAAGGLWTALAATAAGAAYQLHHLERLIAALCRH
jgi:predicted Zn-dependent protease